MKAFCLLALLAAAAPAVAQEPRSLDLGAEFRAFLATHGKSYSSPEEYQLRQLVFNENLQLINSHNANPSRTYELGVNSFADLTWDEFQSQVLGGKREKTAAGSYAYSYGAMQNCSATHTGRDAALRGRAPPHMQAALGAGSGPLSYPPYFDWRSYGVVSEVKSQGRCGSCWTFSTSGALEAHMALKRMRRDHQLTSLELLSEQQLVDCARHFNNNGCNGGLPSQAFEYIKDAGGLNPAWAYPYEDGVQKEGGGHDIHPCRAKTLPAGLGGTVPGGSVNITQGAEEELLAAVALVGPVSIAYQVLPDFRFYKSGVYSNSTHCKTGPDTVNHAVLAVGFGTHVDGTDFWAVKNSWGLQWGDNGYFKIKRGENMCGVATCAAYPDVYFGEEKGLAKGIKKFNALDVHVNAPEVPPKAAAELM